MSAPNARDAATSQAGFTIIEVLVAALLVAVGIVGILAAFDAAGRTALASQRHEQAISFAQREIERLKTYDFNTQLGLTAMPVAGAGNDGNAPGDPTPNAPANPNFYVTGTTLQIMANYSNKASGLQPGVSPNPEPLVGPGDSKLTNPQVNPGPERFTTASSGGGGPTTGSIYRYVTYRKDSCPLSVPGVTGYPCSSSGQDSKRVTVAIVLDTIGNKAGPSKPIWVSSVVTDPKAVPLGVQLPPSANPGSGPAVTAQPFFLYDTPCHGGVRQAPSGHATHNTAQAPAVPPATLCVAPNEPDLMDNDAPPDSTGLSLPDYSNEVTRPASVRGLALRRGSATCPTTYTALSASTLKSTIHTWATNSFVAPFVIPTGARAALSLWTQTIDGNAGQGTLCATLRDAATGVSLASTTYSQPNWPTTPTQISFVFDVNLSTLPSLDRLLLTVSLQSSSTNDIELLYDHSSYASFLSVATTTPLP